MDRTTLKAWIGALAALSLGLIAGAQAQTTLQGKVLDAELLSPLAGANLQWICPATNFTTPPPTGGTASRSDGTFELVAVAKGCSLRVSAIGYQTRWIPVPSPAPNGTWGPLKIVMEPVAQNLEAVVISAGRFEQRLSEVSVSMQILQPELLRQNNLTRLDDAMDRVPGVSIVNGQANIRGTSGFSYGAGSRVQVLLDEMPLLSADANDVRWAFMPMEMLSQIEVIKGASSVLFGSGALGGAIHLRSQWPGLKPGGMLQTYALGYDHPPARFTDPYPGRMPLQSGINGFYQQNSGRLDWTVGAMALTDPGYRVGEFSNRLRANTALRYRLSSKLMLSMAANLMTEKIGNFLFWNNLDSAHFPSAGTNDTLLSRRAMVDPVLRYTDPWGNNHALKNRWYLTQNMGDSDRNVRGLMRYHEYQFQRRFVGPNKSTWVSNSGVTYLHNNVQSEGLYGDRNSRSVALYSQMDIQAGRLGLSLGGRIESTRIESDPRIRFPVFRSGLTYALRPATHLRASVGQGFRAPSVAERYVRAVGGAVEVLPNPTVQPEQGWSGEMGLRQGFKFGAIQGGLDLATFYTRYADMIEFSFVTGAEGIGFKAINLLNTTAVMWGVEAGTEGQARVGTHTLRWMMGYTFTQPTQYAMPIPSEPDYVREDTLKYRSRHLWRSDLLWERGRMQAGINLRYNSFMLKIDDIFYSFIPGTAEFRQQNNQGDWIVDLRAAYQIQQHFKLSVLVRNAFNRAYAIVPGNLGPPRAFLLQAQWNL
ncbi:MAG: TonB-dependent receptor [Bacteroidota bacterium]